MSELEFRSVKDAETWFEGQPQHIRSAIVGRSALRVIAFTCGSAPSKRSNLVLLALRASLVTLCSGQCDNADIGILKEIAGKAFAGADRIAALASSGADYETGPTSDELRAAYAADAAAAAAEMVFMGVASHTTNGDFASLAGRVLTRSALALSPSSPFRTRSAGYLAVLAQCSRDANEAPSGLIGRTLWSHEARSKAYARKKRSFDMLLSSSADWAFWRRWYGEMWDGTFRDWDLAIEVAKIQDEYWEGDDALSEVAREIEKISDRFRTSITVPIIRNNNDTAFRLKDEAPLPDEVLDYIKERVGGALDTALADGGANGFDAECPEAMAIRNALTSRNPSAVAGLLNDASLMFQKNLGNRYPDDGSLIALQAAAFSGAEEICETDDLARARCLRASKLFLRKNPPPLDHADMEKFIDEVAAETEGEAEEIIRQDGKAIASGRAVGRFIRARFANYTSTIVKWIDRTKKGEGRVTWLWKQVQRVMDAFEDPPTDV
ncbi:MAG: hypothetical protein AAGM84_00755 [Pseudomonadota bacterium]